MIVFGSFGAFASSGYELVDYQDPKVDEQGEFYIGDRIFLSTQGIINHVLLQPRSTKSNK